MKRNILLLVITLAGPACSNNTEPGAEPPAKRDYTWSIDSIDYGSSPGIIEIEEMWGSSTTNIWGIAGSAPDPQNRLWHYNGSSWSGAADGTPLTEPAGNRTVNAIWGSGSDDVWAAGRKGLGGVLSAFIMHFDGTHWVDATPRNVSLLESELSHIHGISKDDVWVGGYEYALHFDGTSWSVHHITDSLTVAGIATVDEEVFLYLSSPTGKPDRFLYQRGPADTNFRIVDHTTIADAKFGWRPWIANRTLYSLLNGVTSTAVNVSGQIDTSGWQRDFSVNSYFRGSSVIGPTDVFVVGYEQLVYHFNGMDWKQMFISIPGRHVDPHALFWGVWGDGREVFICDVQNGLVYHGR